jgi:hypothetical protein
VREREVGAGPRIVMGQRGKVIVGLQAIGRDDFARSLARQPIGQRCDAEPRVLGAPKNTDSTRCCLTVLVGRSAIRKQSFI